MPTTEFIEAQMIQPLKNQIQELEKTCAELQGQIESIKEALREKGILKLGR